MKHKDNKTKLYLIQEDGGDCMHFNGIYDNIQIFIKEQMKIIDATSEYKIEDLRFYIKKENIIIKHKNGFSYHFQYEEVKINENYDTRR
jgi:hypothetical protein